VCRQHEEENCEYWSDGEEKLSMRTPEDLKKYMKRRGVRLRMAWDDPDEKAEKKPPSKPRTRRSKKG
jgi:hypothetical protein